MGFLLPTAFALGALALPILLLYMLKLRRQPARVSSLMLWQKVMEDRRTNAPWQRLKRNLLLLLQLLILALLVMALARPYFRVAATVQGNVVLLLDASASMQATDVAPSRFAAAQAQATELLNRLGTDDAVTLVLVAQSPQILASSTTDHAKLRQLINQAQATNGPADWAAGLNLAAANAAALSNSIQPNSGQPDPQEANTTIVLISDGAFAEAAPSESGLTDSGPTDSGPTDSGPTDSRATDPGLTLTLPTMPVPVELISVGASANNQGLVALSLRDGSKGPHLFVNVQNAHDAPARRLVEIQVDGALFDARWLDIPARGQASLTISDLPLGARIVRAQLTDADLPTGRDALAADDVGWAVRSNAATKILMVSQSNFFLSRVLGLLPGVTVQRADPTQPLPTGDFDLYIFDRVDLANLELKDDELPPQGNLFFIAPPASTPLFDVDGTMEQPPIANLQNDDPLLSYVTLGDVRIAQAQSIIPPAWFRTLIGAHDGPLLAVGQEANRRVAILAFDLHQSNLPLQIDFPILMVNIVRWLLPNASQEQIEMLHVNQRYMLPAATSAERLLVNTPLGEQPTFAPDQRAFDGTQALGIYQVFALEDNNTPQGEQTEPTLLAEFAVNLLDETETDIRPRSLAIGAAPSATGGTNRGGTSASGDDASSATNANAGPNADTNAGLTAGPNSAPDPTTGEWEWWWVLALIGLGLLLVEWRVYWKGRMAGENSL